MRRWRRTAAKRRPTARQAAGKRRWSWGRASLVEQLEARLALSATVFTDQPNYVPGAVAQITGNGFDPGEQVTLQIINGDGSTPASGGTPWTANVGTDGSFTSTWTVASAVSDGAAFVLSAAGADGDSATVKFAAAAISSQPQLKMDSWNYQPGATALITGSNFAPNETVTLQVVHSDTGQLGAGDNPWSVTTGADGSFTSTWYVNPVDSPGASFTVTATGSQGDSASADFIDGTELVNNGGFETGNFSGWTQAGNTGATFVSSNNVHSGSYSAQLGPVGSDGYLIQNISTVPGAQYTFSWWLANSGGTPNNFGVYWNYGLVTAANNIPAHGYQQSSYTETASSTSTNIQFYFQNDPSYLCRLCRNDYALAA